MTASTSGAVLNFLGQDGEPLQVGRIYWADNVVGFPGRVMKCRLLRDCSQEIAARGGSAAIIDFHFGTVREDRCVWVEQVGTPAIPVGPEPWVTRWPAGLLQEAGR